MTSASAITCRTLLFFALLSAFALGQEPANVPAAYNVTVSPWVNHRVYAPLALPVNSQVMFMWNGAHGVYLIPTDQCPEDYPAGDNELYAASAASSMNNMLTVTLTDPGTYYFACQVSDHCSEDGQKLVVTVTNSTAGNVTGFTTSTA